MSHTAYLVQRGNRVTYSNSGSLIPAKNVVVRQSGATGKIGISVDSIPATTGTGELAIGGGDERVWNLPKHTGEVFTDAQVLYWNPTSEYLTGTNTSTNTRAGRSVGAFASAATTANFVLND